MKSHQISAIRIGVIGAGGNATGNAKAFLKYPGRCRVVAVADPVLAAAQKLADQCGAKAYSHFTDFLDEVDAVVISSPNFLHAEQTIICAAHGKHVWCEKPMALSDEEARRMVEAVNKAGVSSFVGFSVRFDPTTLKMKEIFDSGALGEPVSVWSRRLCYFPPEKTGSWRFDYEKSGGVMSELMAHEIDWIVHFLGEPASVYCRKASRQHADPRDNDHVWLAMAYPKELTATIEGSQMAPISDYYRGIVGTKASVYTARWGEKLEMVKVGTKTAIPLELGPVFPKHLHFLDVIDGRAKSVADIAWGSRIVHLSMQAIASAVNNRVVEIQPLSL